MSPFRIILIGALLYLFFLLLKKGRAEKRQKKYQAHTAHPPHGAIQDTLVEDPVCNTYIPKKQAIRLRHHNTTMYFCSEKCCETFLQREETP